MTKVTHHYNLRRPLGENDFANVGALHSVYGIVRVLPSEALDKLTVDFDASRLMKKDLDATLARFGMPLAA